MYSYKVYVYAISKNEEKFVRRWADSMKEADGIFVTDTGSSDNTVPLLREQGVTVFEEQIIPWRFDKARNLSLSHVPLDGDICVCTDLDEVFLPGWRKALEKGWIAGSHMGNYLYNWSVNPDGSPGVQMIYFKIHTRRDYVWEYPVHECLRYTGKVPEKKVFLPGITLNHYPDPQKSRGSYLPLLIAGAREMPQDSRMAYYLGREYMYHRQYENCIQELKRHLSLPSSLWKEERCASMRWIAKSYAELANPKEAFRWYFRAIAEAPSMRDAYVEAALLAYLQEDWDTCFYLSEQALKIREKSACFVNAAYAWDYTPEDLAALACAQLGLYERALTHAQNALKLAPENERLKKNAECLASFAARDKTPSLVPS